MGAGKEPPRSAVRFRGASFALGSAFFLLYLGWGLAFHLRAPRVFYYTDQVFDADIPTRIMDLVRFGGPHRTRLHPLFVLLLNPIGLAIRAGLQVAGLGRTGRLTALFMCALAGALGVALFRVLLARCGVAPARAFLWSLVFGFSSSQLFFASMPESFVFSGLSLVTVFVLAAGSSPGGRGLFLASVASFGMVVTNLAAALLARAPSGGWGRTWESRRRLAAWVGGVVLVTGVLSLVQLWIYPGSALFFVPTELHRDDWLSFVWPADLADVLARAKEIVSHLFFTNLLAAKIEVTQPAQTAVDFPPPSLDALRPGGLVHALLWASLLGIGLLVGRRSGFYRQGSGLGLLVWVALQVGVHSVFGTSLFLYSCQWTFAVVALGALSWEPLLALRPSFAWGLGAALLVLIGLEAAGNSAFMMEILRVFA